MTDTEAMREIDALAERGCLVWIARRPAHLGGGYTVQVTRPGGADKTGHGVTLAEALDRVRLDVPARPLGRTAGR